MQHFPAVLTFLQSLAHTGDRGFEGLVCAVLGAETGQRFVRVWSGDQRGRDAQSTTMAMEAKHYFTSRLSQRELIAEIHQAASLRPGPELWLLVTPVAVDPDNWQELAAIAGEKGLDTLAIDGASRGVPRLIALLAARRAEVLAFAAAHLASTDRAALEADLDAVAAHPAYADVLGELRMKLRSTLFGHADAARRCHNRLLRILGHEGDAFNEFAQSAAVRAPAACVVRRRAEPFRHLTRWLDSQAKEGVHTVALGEEGVGKTWAVLDWLADLYCPGREIIIVPFSATAVALAGRQTVSDLLPILLAGWTGVGDAASWEARMQYWLGDDTPRPLILVVADGLSERTDITWPDIFRPVGQPAWTGRVAVLATDRLLHWEPLDGSLAARGFQTQVQVGPFTDRELQGALAGSGIEVKTIPAEMLPLMKTARYCRLTVQHYAAMRAEGDVTRERLLYIDARERATDKAAYPISEDEFNEIIKGAAQRHREIARSLGAADIRQMIPFRERERDVYSELTTGGVFVRDGGSDRFRIEPARLAYALGLLLSGAVREEALAGATPEAIADGIARWFEPERDADLKVEAAGGALFHATIDETFPTAARRELLRYWLGLRNWGEEASTAFVGYIFRLPRDFVAMAEHFWAAAHDRGAAQALLARAFAEHRDAPQVRPYLVAATERWFGFVHSDGLPILRQVPNRGPAEPSAEEIAERVAAITSHMGTTLPPLTAIADDGLLRLSGVGLLIASAGSRMPFAQGLVTRALAASAMGMDISSSKAA